MVHTNDLYILIRNACIEITHANLTEQRKAYLPFFAFLLQEKTISWPESGQSKYQKHSLEICDLVQDENTRHFHFKAKDT